MICFMEHIILYELYVLKSVREEFCEEIDSNSCFFDDNIIHIGNIYLVNLHHGFTMDNISGGCSRFCISRVPEPSHPLSYFAMARISLLSMLLIAVVASWALSCCFVAPKVQENVEHVTGSNLRGRWRERKFCFGL